MNNIVHRWLSTRLSTRDTRCACVYSVKPAAMLAT